ncbi:hypothetical protein [Providencia rettgeri]|uniref:hypothetical protein n=1 Tax=Providencia rettgeri TaxID=587 RepID=UPI0034E08049
MSHDIRQRWIDAGWKRGAFVDLSKNTQLVSLLPEKLQKLYDLSKPIFMVPVLYDCALISTDFDSEPWVQVLVGTCTDPHSNFRYGKHPRRIHLTAKQGSDELCIEFSAMGFLQISRESLLECKVEKDIEWGAGELGCLLDWIAERYRKSVFPDAFNRRIDTKKKRLKRIWGKENFSEYCSGVYFKLDTHDELPDDIDYKLQIILTIPSKFKGREYKDIKDRINDEEKEALLGIFAAIGQDKIDTAPSGEEIKKRICHITLVENTKSKQKIQILSEDEFTKRLEREFSRYSLEEYSFSSEEEASYPAEFISGNEQELVN